MFFVFFFNVAHNMLLNITGSGNKFNGIYLPPAPITTTLRCPGRANIGFGAGILEPD